MHETGKSRHTQNCEKITGSHRQSQEFQRFTGSGPSGKSHALIPRKSQNAVIQTCEGTGVLGKTFEGVDIRYECVNIMGSGFEGVSCESDSQTSKFESILNPHAAAFIVNSTAVVSSNENDMLNQIDSNAEGPLTTEQTFVQTNEGLVGVSIQSLSEQKKEDLINGLVTRVLDLSAEIQESDQHYDFRSSNVQYFQFDELEEEKRSYAYIQSNCNLVELNTEMQREIRILMEVLYRILLILLGALVYHPSGIYSHEDGIHLQKSINICIIDSVDVLFFLSFYPFIEENFSLDFYRFFFDYLIQLLTYQIIK